MPFLFSGSIKYYTFTSFSPHPVVHGIFTRNGGVSPKPWNSLNLGGNNGDERCNVIENRRRVFETLKLPVASLFDVWQIHSSDVIYTNSPRPLESVQMKADAIMTDCQNVTLFMRFGDCVPILLYDTENSVIALVHAGWPGTVKQIAKQTVKTMMEKFNTKAYNVIAGIGPSIGPDHYVIQEDVIEQVKIVFKSDFERVLIRQRNHTYFDLWTANRMILESIGVEKIEISQICTACNTQDWYSHREEKGKTGRFGAILALN